MRAAVHERDGRPEVLRIEGGAARGEEVRA